ncbi:hypothetical protein Tco_0640282 [Tanacetum coccineum]
MSGRGDKPYATQHRQIPKRGNADANDQCWVPNDNEVVRKNEETRSIMGIVGSAVRKRFTKVRLPTLKRMVKVENNRGDVYKLRSYDAQHSMFYLRKLKVIRVDGDMKAR